MRITLSDALTLRLLAIAAPDRLPLHVVVERLLLRALNMPLDGATRIKAVDRNSSQVMDILRGNTGGLTVHDICGITGWCYLTATKVMRHMVEQGLVNRERIPTCGAPAWSYTARSAAAPAAGAETPAADASTSGNGDLSLL